MSDRLLTARSVFVAVVLFMALLIGIDIWKACRFEQIAEERRVELKEAREEAQASRTRMEGMLQVLLDRQR